MSLSKHFYVLFFAVSITFSAGAQSYQIGFSFRTFTDADRGRDIPVAVYYPSVTGGEESPVAGSLAGFPVVSFGHGFVINTEAYSWLWEALVPEGYILIFPRTEGQLLPAPDHEAFGEDIAFCAAEIVRLGSLSSGPLSGKVYPRVAYMGHSMGGGAAYLGAENNGEVAATVTFAAADTDPSSIAAAAEVTAPSLVIAAAEDCVTPESSTQVPLYQNLSAEEKAFVSIEGASHCNFTDGSASLCYLGEGFSCAGFGPFISRELQHERTIEVLLPWLNNYLKSECEAAEAFATMLSAGVAEEKWTTEFVGLEALGCPDICEVPQNLSGTITPEGGALLEWDAVPAALGYRCKVRRAGGGQSAEFLTAEPFVLIDQLPSNAAGNALEFRVSAYCPFTFGSGANSAWVPLDVPASLFANMQGAVLVTQSTFDYAQSGYVEIFDLAGRIISQRAVSIGAQDFPSGRVDLSDLPRGVYIVSLIGQRAGNTTLKIVMP